MAVLILSPFSAPVLSPSTSRTTSTSDPTCRVSFLQSARDRRHSSTTISSYKPRDAVASEAKKVEFYELYGLDPTEFLSESSSKTNRRGELGKKTRKGKRVLEEDPSPPRTTHKLLQVLAGKAKRKKLLSPTGMDVRPMMEVVKGAAFDMLQMASGCPASLRPGRWLDLYSGTGSVGIEALSRGCSEAHFVEMDPWVVSDILRPNLECTGFLDASFLHTVCVEDFLERAQHYIGKDGNFDYISVTPPYTEVEYSVLMSKVTYSSLVREDTFIVVEYPLRTNMPDSCGCLTKIADRRFGRTHLAIYGPKWAQKRRK